MQILTLQELFGVNAVQTADELIIKKSDLSAVGLTTTANNGAEQLFVAILLKALSTFQGYLIDEFGNILSDEMGDIIGYDNRELYEFLEMFRWNAYAKERNGNVYLTETIVLESYVQAN
ncbi:MULTISPECIES: hypothetical protein [unclassified Nostoc]|uniref:hypothetical protein n=1 Tax=unclassified Nostoc TaxID=2593658 RepID=UPI002AD40033|nr:hypothetical protein [Nostoc sp. DedQUE03]MDZ7977213.1 hypothetical protein [Nostoc sp. DedQUE03]MDZ8047666.1 hypothetical protein [Nostoc sp. DedQUE02]